MRYGPVSEMWGPETGEVVDNPPQSNRSWFAIRVRPKFEGQVAAGFRGKGYEEFLPLYRAKRRWSDRVKMVDLPLFPGYLFCRLNIRERLLPVLTTPGVIRIVGAGKNPIAIGDDEIAAIQAVIRSGLPTIPWPSLAPGSRVFIERGPLAGLEGVAVNVEKKYRLIVSVSLLQRSVAVEIEREWVRPILNGAGANAVPQAERLRGSARVA